MTLSSPSYPVQRCPYTDPFDQSIWYYLELNETIKMETDELFIRAVDITDQIFFRALFSDPEVMKNFTDHEARHRDLTPAQWKQEQTEAADRRLAQLIKRWTGDSFPFLRAENRDPFSGFVIIHKKTAKILAHVTAGHTSPPTPGTAEIALMIPKKEWNQRNGTFAIEFITNYLVALSRIYFKWCGKPLEIDGANFSEINAVVRLGNQYSIRIFDKRMTRYGEIERWDLRWVQYRSYISPPLLSSPVLKAKL
jgi:RimJ/RimL family protein N-acetyltransferase